MQRTVLVGGALGMPFVALFLGFAIWPDVAAATGEWTVAHSAILQPPALALLVALAVRARLERARAAALFLYMPGQAIAQADGARASDAVEFGLQHEPARQVRQALLLLAEWAALEPHGRRLIESAVLPPATRELLWEVAANREDSDVDRGAALSEAQQRALFVGGLQLGIRRVRGRTDPRPGLEYLALALHLGGRFRMSLAAGRALYELDGRSVTAYNAACSAARLGELDEASSWLDRMTDAVMTREQALADDDLAAVRSTSAFEAMLGRQRVQRRRASINTWFVVRAAKRPAALVRRAMRAGDMEARSLR